MIVMLNLVLIDVICIVSFPVYGSTRVMWDCTYVLWVVEFVYYQLCFEFITPVFVHEMFWWMWTFFLFEKGFLQKREHHRTKLSLLNAVYSVTDCWISSLYARIRPPKCSPPYLERECRNVFWGVHVFEFKALYVFFFILLFCLKFCQTCTG